MQTTTRSVVRLPASAREGIERGVRIECSKRPGVETAGVMHLSRHGNGMAHGPGPQARCTPNSCEWDAEAVFASLCIARDLGSTILGRWHKHTSPIILASDTDKESARAFLEATGLPEMLDLIVACDAEDKPIGWALYVCTPDEYRRAELVWQ